MPILDVQIVQHDAATPRQGLARALADVAASIFRVPTARVWVRLSVLPRGYYAENGVASSELPSPVFVTVLHAVLPEQSALGAEAHDLCTALATVIGCASEVVHIEYAPPGRGRMAFGGKLVQ